MADEVDSHGLLQARGLVMKHDFMRAAGLSEEQFFRLHAEGVIQVMFRGDKAFGLPDDDLPTADALTAAGVPVAEDYLDELRFDIPPDFRPSPGAVTWTIGWD